MLSHLILAAVAAATLLLPDAPAQAGPLPWNRHVDTVGIVPVAGKPGHFRTTALWGVGVSPSTALLTLDTVVELRIGSYSKTLTFTLSTTTPITGGCGSCAPGCGEGATNGMAMSLLCLSNGPVGCSCQFPPIKADFGEVLLQPGDEIAIILYPAPGALPEFDASDDLLVKTFQGPHLWDRQIVAAELVPSATGGAFDLKVDWTLGSAGLQEEALVSPKFDVYVDGYHKYAYVGPCGPWILAPGNHCFSCTGQVCATIKCNGQTVSTSICEESPNGLYCGCFSSTLFQAVIPGIVVEPGQQVVVKMEAVEGTLPELPGLEQDNSFALPGPFGTWTDLGHPLAGAHGDPELSGAGMLIGGTPVTISLSQALENAPAFLVAGPKGLKASFKGGVMIPDPAPPAVLLALPTNAAGKVVLGGAWPLGLPSGFKLYMQWWILDAAGPHGFASSNGLLGITP